MNTKSKYRGLSKGIYILPSFFTVMAMFGGFYAIIAGINLQFETACIALYMAMLLDSLDGRIARLCHTESDFGAELDSLSDMLCFGIAPAVLLYLWNLKYLGKLGWLAAFIYAVAVALRLARFNTQDSNAAKVFFQGISSTAAAGFSVGLIYVGDLYGMGGFWIDVSLASIVLIVSGLMVSNVPYRSFKNLNFRYRIPFVTICVLVLIIVLITIEPPEVLLGIFSIYLLSGPCELLYRHIKR